MNRHAILLRRSSSTALAGGDGSGSRYLYPPKLVLSVAASILLGRKRVFSADAKQLINTVVPEPRMENAHLIPREDPFIVVTNHYYKPGYHVWWGIALITAAIAQPRHSCNEIVWLMTNRWTYQDPLRSRLFTPLTYLFFTKLAHTYGFVSTPPMPPQPRYTEEGARSVRQVLSLLDSSPNGEAPIIGLAPEGRDSPDGSLIEPPPGTGRLLLYIAKRGYNILPVGVAEIDGVLRARFGPSFALEPWPGLNKKERDRQASAQIMIAIGAQLPPGLWGAYHIQIEQVAGKGEPDGSSSG